LVVQFTNLITALDVTHIKIIKKLINTVDGLQVEVSFQCCLMGGLSELNALSECHKLFIHKPTQYPTINATYKHLVHDITFTS